MSVKIFYDEVNFRLQGWRKAVRLFKKVIRNEKKIPGDLIFIITSDSEEKKLNIGKTFPNFSDFKGSLTALKETRDSIAHTQIRCITPTIDAPSFITPHFDKIFLGLKILENEVRKL